MTTLRDIIDWDDRILVRWNGEPALWLEGPIPNLFEALEMVPHSSAHWFLADESTSVPADLDEDAHDVAAEWIGDGIELSYDMPLPIVGETCRDCGLSAVQPRTINHASNCSRR